MAASRQGDILQRPIDAIPTVLGDWTATGDATLGAEVVRVLRPTAYLSRTYRGAGDPVGLFIAYYDRHRAGATIHSPRNCLPGGGWEILKSYQLKIPMDGQPIQVNRYSARNGDNTLAIYYWYQSPRRILSSEMEGKLFLIWDSLGGGPTSGSLVRLITRESPDADAEASRFAKLLIPEYQACLGR